MNISGAIFDLDGTLLDTTEIWEGVAARYITSLRKTPEPGLREKTKAMTLTMLCSYLKDEYRIATTESKIAKGFNTILREDYLESADIKQYVPILLEKFKQKGVAMCITTSTDKAFDIPVGKFLDLRFILLFVFIGNGNDVKISSLAPRMASSPSSTTMVSSFGVPSFLCASRNTFGLSLSPPASSQVMMNVK